MKTIVLCLLLFSTISILAQTTEREQQVLDEINLVRTDPTGYIQYIDSFLDYWESGATERAAALELKKELKKMQPLPALQFSPDLYITCKKHGEYIAKTKKFEHSDCDCGENIQYGNSDIRFAIIDLLVDSGIEGRGHRKNLLNPEYKYFAVYEVLNSSEKMKYVFVQQFNR